MSWITDRLPEPGKRILVYDAYYGVRFATYDFGIFYCQDLGVTSLSYVTGWMEVPEQCKSQTRLIDNVVSYRIKL